MVKTLNINEFEQREITPLHRQLKGLDFLGAEDFVMLDSLLEYREDAEEGEWIVMEGQQMDRTYVLLDGWTFRYKTFKDGRRQILNFILPGDIIGLHSVMLRRADCGIEALTPVTMAVFPSSELIQSLTASPRLLLALTWVAGQSERMMDEHITRVGRRSAVERMAHLFVELYVRMRRIGADPNEACALPLTQALLADTLGMSHVHANRSFRTLVKDKSVELRNGRPTILDVFRLANCANFDRDYLEQPEVPADVEKASNRLLPALAKAI